MGPWGTARPVTARLAPSQRRPGLPGRSTRAAPRRAPYDGTTAEAARPPCALYAAANASSAHFRCWAMRQRGQQPPARAHGDLKLLQRPGRPLPWPSRQLWVAASRRPCGGLTTCETRQARSHMSGEVKRQGWGSAGPVTFTSPEGLWAIICMHMHGMNSICMPERTSIGRPPRTAERMETVAASAAAASRTTAVEPLRLATVAAHTEPPARTGWEWAVRACMGAPWQRSAARYAGATAACTPVGTR